MTTQPVIDAAPELARLGHIALVTPDLDASVRFFGEVVGLDLVERDAEAAYLRAWGDTEHHTLVLRAGTEARVDHVGWRTRRPGDVDAFARRLREHGAPVRDVPAGGERGHGDAIEVVTPAGFTYEIYHEVEKAPRNPDLPTNSGRQWARGMSPRRIDHVNLAADDVAGERAWSERELGFRTHEFVSDGDGDCRMAWMAVSALAHDLAVGQAPGGATPGLHHVAYFVDSPSDVLRAADIVNEHQLRLDYGPGRHAVSQAVCLYVRDPGSGHRVEIYSGSYLVLDPDWEPIEWTPTTYRQWWGAEVEHGPGAAMDHVTGWRPAQGSA